MHPDFEKIVRKFDIEVSAWESSLVPQRRDLFYGVIDYTRTPLSTVGAGQLASLRHADGTTGIKCLIQIDDPVVVGEGTILIPLSTYSPHASADIASMSRYNGELLPGLGSEACTYLGLPHLMRSNKFICLVGKLDDLPMGLLIKRVIHQHKYRQEVKMTFAAWTLARRLGNTFPHLELRSGRV